MKAQARSSGGHKRKLPFLTDEELNAPLTAVTIHVTGSYTKRAEHRKEVYEDHYEADIVVPQQYSMGQVKLQINRYIKEKLHGIRARTFVVDSTVAPVKVDGKFKVRDFMSHHGILDNDSAKRLWNERQKRLRDEAERRNDPNYVPPEISDTTHYGDDGLPPLVNQPSSWRGR